MMSDDKLNCCMCLNGGIILCPFMCSEWNWFVFYAEVWHINTNANTWQSCALMRCDYRSMHGLMSLHRVGQIDYKSEIADWYLIWL